LQANQEIEPRTRQRHAANLLKRYFEVHFDDVAGELAASGPDMPGPMASSVVRKRELAAAKLREFIRGLIRMQPGLADRESAMDVVAQMEELTSFQRDLLRTRITDVLDRVEARPSVRMGAAARTQPAAPASASPLPAPAPRAETPEHEEAEVEAQESDAPPDAWLPPAIEAPAGLPQAPAASLDTGSAIASVLHALTLKCLETLDTDLAQVFLADGDGRLTLRAEAPAESGTITGPRALEPDSGFTAMVRAVVGPVALQDTAQLSADEEPWIERGMSRVAGVAVGTPGEPDSGVLITGRMATRPFSDEELTELAAAAGEVTLAMASADLVSRAEELAVLKERMKLAREIHDGLASDLSAVVALFKYHEHRRQVDPGDAENLLVQMRELTEQSLQNARDILATLRPRQQVPRRLAEAIRRHVEDFSQTHGITAITRILGEDDNLDEEERDALFQVLREALTNVRKHSEAGTLNITLDVRQRPYSVVIEDDGVGIDITALEDKVGSFGLLGMRERAEMLGGHVEISNGAMGGARIAFYGPPVPLRRS
jgi:signal transduction histidine kinase